MAFNTGGHIITDGLVLYYDAGNGKSAKSGSASWNDLIGNNNATYDATTFYNESGWYYISGSGGYLSQENSILFPSGSSWSFSQWQKKPVGSPSVWKAFCGTNIQGPGGYFYYAPILRYYQAYIDSTYYGIMGANTIDGSFTYTPTEGVWFNITLAYNGDTHGLTVMVNGDEFVQTRTVSWYSGVDNFQFKYVGNYINGSNKAFQGYIATHIVWDRELSAAEVLQNFNSQRARFGI